MTCSLGTLVSTKHEEGLLRFDDLVANCISNDGRCRGDLEFTHGRGPVRLDRLDAQTKDCTYLFVGVAFRNQLDDEPLARRQRTFAFGASGRQYDVSSSSDTCPAKNAL